MKWTAFTGGCRGCGETFRISQEAIDKDRPFFEEPITDAEIANTFSFCQSCAGTGGTEDLIKQEVRS